MMNPSALRASPCFEDSWPTPSIEPRDQIFTGARPEGAFLSGLRNRNAMLKSAVYLLHGSGYADVRAFILQSSSLVIQDDSGIPYREFRKSDWEEHLFGSYTRPEPLGTLQNPPQQPLLARQYSSGNQPLNFPYGYGAVWGKGRSNLMLFVKKAFAGAAGVPPDAAYSLEGTSR